MTKKEIAEILVRRDNISYGEAFDIIKECQEEINEAIDCGEGLDVVEDILAGDLGLELDYIWAFI